MTLVIDHLRALQHEGGDGPELWQAAWDRAIDLLAPLWPDARLRGTPNYKVWTGEALAAGLYLVAGERGIDPADVHRADIHALIADGHDYQIVERLSARLRALGHDLDAPDDPVATHWRRLIWTIDDLPERQWEIAIQDIAANVHPPVIAAGLRYLFEDVPDDKLQF